VEHVGWVTRGGRRYYYRSYRHEGRTKRQYLGSGPQAEQAAAAVAKAWADRADEAKRLAQDGRSYKEAVVPLELFCRLTDKLVVAALADQGYHRHRRGEWRRRRGHGKDGSFGGG
jgi:hypothetical protein